MSLNSVLVLLFVLFLIDKHNAWRTVWRRVCWFTKRGFTCAWRAVTGLGWSIAVGVCLWLVWMGGRIAYKTVADYLAEQHAVSVSACVDRNVKNNVVFQGLGTACENNLAFQGIPTISRMVLERIDVDATLAENARVQHESNTVALWAVIIGFGTLGLFIFWRT